MKKLMQRFFGIAVSAAMLFTSGLTAVADGHSHSGGTVIDSATLSGVKTYTITLTHPESKPFVEGDVSNPSSGSHYGAYQIFSGTVKGEDYTEKDANPGNTNVKIPITDIKWGNAFCSGSDGDLDPTTDDGGRTNILKFVYALYKAPTGDYKYAFDVFEHDFDGFITTDTTTKLSSDYTDGSDVTFSFDTAGKVTTIYNLDKVKYDKLAVAIADIVAAQTKREWLQAFNDILGGYGQGSSGSYLNEGYVNRFYEGKINDPDKTKYEIKVPAGYYMIRDLSSLDGADESYSARMLFVANNVEQELKESVPTLGKTISRDGGVDNYKYETEAAGVGDEVDFRLTGTLPDNYNLYLGGYQYKFTDTLSKGLTLKGTESETRESFDYNFVTVSVLGANVDGVWTADTTFTIATEDIIKTEHSHPNSDVAYTSKVTVADGIQTLEVYFPCLKEISKTIDSKKYTLGAKSTIYIDYTAIVNENAIVSPTNGNQNTAVLTYSDNPQSYGDTDETTPDHATVYTFGLDIVKIDAAQYLRDNGTINESALEGVKFVVVRKKAGTSSDATEWEIARFKKIDPDIDSKENLPDRFKYFGYYSVKSWESITDGDSTPVKSEKFNAKWLDNQKYKGIVDYNIETLTDGVLNISGLDAGVEYTIAETDTPKDAAGKEIYAKIDPFTITLTAYQNPATKEYNGKLSNAESPENTTGSFTFAKPVQITDKFEGDPLSESDGSAQMLVANFKYTDLPSTGGVGTVWFYILGAGGVGLAGVLFFLSKKKVTK